MRTSDAARVDHEYRHYRKAQSLLASLESRYAWYSKHHSDRLLPLHDQRLSEMRALLRRETSGQALLWEINTYLSRRPVLTVPTTEIMNYIFYNLPPPKKAYLTDMEQHLADLMSQRYHQAMAKQHYFTLMCEIAYRAKQNWYFIFNTLTVKPEVYHHAFNKDAKYFRTYIRAFDRDAARAAHQSIRKARNQDYHLYLACTEQGSQNGRLHLHIVHATKQLPTHCTDPNYGRTQPSERLLPTLRRYWTAGRSDPRMVRYSPNDAYGLAGYRWPLDKGEPLQIKSPLAIANYISKYIQQGYDTCLRRKLQWRVKKSHKLGHALLNEMLEPLSTSTLWVITSLDTLNLKLNNTTIPLPLLRHLTLKILQNRLSSTSTSPTTTLTTIAKRTTPRLSPLHSLRASTQTILESSLASSRFLKTLDLNETDTYKAALDELRTQLRIINTKYFLTNIGITGTASSSHTVRKRPQHSPNTTSTPTS